MEKSATFKNLAKALSTFQVKVDKIKKDATNPFFKKNYASLSNIQDAIAVPLQESGLVYSQMPSDQNNLTTILVEVESGEYFQSTYNMPVARINDPQAVGSAITYAKRYALVAILGLNIDDDDDGNLATKKDADFKDLTFAAIKQLVEECKDEAEVTALWKKLSAFQKKIPGVSEAVAEKGKSFKGKQNAAGQ